MKDNSNNIVNLNDRRNLSFESNMLRVFNTAKSRFYEIEKFKNQNFESDTWKYEDGTLYFKDRANNVPYSAFISNTVKSFIISRIYKKRVSKAYQGYSTLKNLLLVARYLHQFDVNNIYDLTNIKYNEIYAYLYKQNNAVGYIDIFNSFIKFLKIEHVLVSNVDIIREKSKSYKFDESEDFKAIESKIPDADLIKSIITLKRKIEDADDYPSKSRDLLCIYTQAFQYGLGLRVNEVLRLSRDCLFEFEGKLICRVWTEKGAEPILRIVLADWREIIQEVYDKIISLTEQTRIYAKELEESGTNSYIENGFNKIKIERELKYNELIDRLDEFFEAKKQEVISYWKINNINPDTLYDINDIELLFPVSSSAKRPIDKLKAYTKWGLNFTSTKISRYVTEHNISGSDLLAFINDQIFLRSSYLTENELLSILHDRKITREKGRDKKIFEAVSELNGSSATCFTFDPENYQGKGRAPTAMSKDKAIELLNEYANSLLPDDQLSITELKSAFPDLPFSYEIEKNKHLEITSGIKIATKVDLLKKPNSPVEYSVSAGYSVNSDSIKRYALSRFFIRNHSRINKLNEFEISESLEKFEDLNSEYDECILPSTILSSKSFETKIKVSDYLFLLPMQISSLNNQISFIPEILNDDALYYFYKGNDRNPSAFERFDIENHKKISQMWQSHQGRHWRTTSLFRSGASKSLVNKLMGRKDEQAKHYDHNTGSERAKIIAKSMVENTNRFIGDLPRKISELKKSDSNTVYIDDLLKKEMQTISYTPTGFCTQSLDMNPCEYHLRCLIGKDGSGCKKLVIDIEDPATIPMLQGIRDEAKNEIERLVTIYDETQNVSIENHLRSKIKILDNAQIVLNKCNNILDNKGSELSFIAFDDGSNPDDCPFQCGDD